MNTRNSLVFIYSIQRVEFVVKPPENLFQYQISIINRISHLAPNSFRGSHWINWSNQHKAISGIDNTTPKRSINYTPLIQVKCLRRRKPCDVSLQMKLITVIANPIWKNSGQLEKPAVSHLCLRANMVYIGFRTTNGMTLYLRLKMKVSLGNKILIESENFNPTLKVLHLSPEGKLQKVYHSS